MAGLVPGGVRLELLRQDHPYSGAYRRIATTRSDATGAYGFRVSRVFNSVRLRVRVAGSTKLISPELSLSAQVLAKLTVGAKKARTVRLRGTVFPATAATTVSLQRRSPSGTWRRVRTLRPARQGRPSAGLPHRRASHLARGELPHRGHAGRRRGTRAHREPHGDRGGAALAAGERAGVREAGPGSRVVDEAWDGEDLSGREFREVAFVDVDFTDARGSGVIFDACTFTDCRLSGVRFTGSQLTNCSLRATSLFDAELSDCKLLGSNLDHVRAELLRVSGGDWSFVSLREAALREARLEDVRLSEADLTGARLDQSSVRRCDLSSAVLVRASLRGTDLRGSVLPAIDPLTVGLGGAIVDPLQAMHLAAGLGLDVRDDEEPAPPGF